MATTPVVTALVTLTTMTIGMSTLTTHTRHIHVVAGVTKQLTPRPQPLLPPLVSEVQERCSFQVTEGAVLARGLDDRLTMTQTDRMR